MLAYASMTQAGLILAEIGLGLRLVPLVHVVSHAVLRSLQILRSPSAMHDRHELAAALGGPPGVGGVAVLGALPAGTLRRLFRVALDRGLDETLVMRCGVVPLRGALEAAAVMERRWVAFLGGAEGVSGRSGGDGGAA
jgi:NAD(P)H-quinone oxidoreductase subunit 5